MVTSTLATLVRVMATMKAVNMPAQHSAETHTSRGARNNWPHSAGPRMASSAMLSASALKALRQKVTSKLRAAVQMPRDHARRAPQQGDQDHQKNSAAMRHEIRAPLFGARASF
jgi:hypothetical protein